MHKMHSTISYLKTHTHEVSKSGGGGNGAVQRYKAGKKVVFPTLTLKTENTTLRLQNSITE